jgi:hypothetical protein
MNTFGTKFAGIVATESENVNYMLHFSSMCFLLACCIPEPARAQNVLRTPTPVFLISAYGLVSPVRGISLLKTSSDCWDFNFNYVLALHFSASSDF